MRVRFPLIAKILLWLFLNLTLLAAGFLVLFWFQFHSGSFLSGRAAERVQATADTIAAELSQKPQTEWNTVLQRSGDAWHVRFYLFTTEGAQVAGNTIPLPDEVKEQLAAHTPQAGRGPPPGRGPRRFTDSTVVETTPSVLEATQARFMTRSSNPSTYWTGVCLRSGGEHPGRTARLVLLSMSRSLHGSLFFDASPWIIALLVAAGFSILFWFPILRGITRSLSQMTQVTGLIAGGHFDSRVNAKRNDELGCLGSSINRMADQLSGYVTGQKRFLGDIAHELCSPIARMQLSLGILEQNGVTKERLNDLQEDLEEMSTRVNEILSFSKASLTQNPVPLSDVPIVPLIQNMIKREVPNTISVLYEPENNPIVHANPELLSRAVANILRNAVRYAGQSGPILIRTVPQDNHVCISIADSGPGVPPEMLDQIFTPFFRLDPSHSRDTGGAGLGLAIVKSSIEACGGHVSAANRQPTGLVVTLSLNSAPPSLSAMTQAAIENPTAATP